MIKKSFLKKIKIKKSGVILRKPMAVGHNRTRKTSKLLRNKRKQLTLTGVNSKLLKNYLYII